MTAIENVDLAKTDPCPACGTPVRRFANTPLWGTGNDTQAAGPWFCPACVHSGLGRRSELGIIAALRLWAWPATLT